MSGVRQRIGYALLNLGRTEEAMVALRQEVDVSPQSSQTHYLLGEAYLQLQEFASFRDEPGEKSGLVARRPVCP